MTDSLSDFDGLLNWPSLQDWVATQSLPGTGPITAVNKLSGGSQNNIFLLSRKDASFVLRRPPKHLRPNSNETMLREARVLAALKAALYRIRSFMPLALMSLLSAQRFM
ncbi:phosphotransferase family protein [Herminiimonas arsenitoxidans]|uniref:phosphotransferase family protein n=1 Tax=Herminiimonas arsenitoxidans TaxID=1809410 RepID=UPI0018D295DD|nr:hypothetical protein [Herminiimonas arsenitoxidans]